MFQKLTYLFSFVVMAGLLLTGAANAADPDLHGWWRFDEGSGTTASDFSTYANNGTLQNGPTWAAGKIGGAVRLDGVDDFVEVPHHVSLTASTEVTVMAWINTPRTAGPGTEAYQGVIGKGNSPRSYSLYTTGGVLHFSVGPGGAYIGSTSSGQVPINEWAHVCAMVKGGQHQYYINGENAGTGGAGTVLPGATDTANLVIGRTQEGATRSFLGLIDDPRVYTRGLTQDEVKTIMRGEGIPYATSPNPPDGGTHLDTWITLSWRAGDFAVSHDVYLGDNLDDVNNGTGGTFRVNQASTYYVAGFPGFAYPDGLVPGTTYYWRIDEVNVADPNSPWKGEIWRFSIPPKKAYNPVPADGAESVDVNVKLSWRAGFGAKLHTVYFGTNFDTVSSAAGGLPQGVTTYSPTGLKRAKTYYWRVDEFDAVTTHKGDVWSFTTLGAVGNPNPANGAVDVKQTPVLSWTPGAYAASHEVYFGVDAVAVTNATKTSAEFKATKALGDESYAPGKLPWETSYYWRIDEVNNVNPDSPWVGKVWSFTTADYAVIDDFEDYDAADNQIWYAWHDGLGYGVPGTPPYFAGNGTGAAVGDENTASFTEEMIVHGGKQSMPVAYDNNKQGKAKYSEVELKLTNAKDWTEQGVAELSIWFRGLPGSVGSFAEAPAGTFTMTASGTDIWDVGTAGNYHDEFHFAYKTLTGAGSIVARVQSVQNTNGWAKAGVMIRESLTGGSRHMFAAITPSNGVAAQGRPDTGAASFNANQTGVTAPHWVKLERDLAGNFTVTHSANGTTWQPVTGATPQNIQMGSNVYIGLAVTSHDAALTCQAVFTNVTTTGTVGAQWAHQDIGIASNAAEPLYVAVSNAAGQPAAVVHPNPAAATTTTWTEWVIPLQSLAGQGITLSNMDRIAVGLGTRGNQTTPGGSGKMYFDDIRLYRPRTAP